MSPAELSGIPVAVWTAVLVPGLALLALPVIALTRASVSPALLVRVCVLGLVAAGLAAVLAFLSGGPLLSPAVDPVWTGLERAFLASALPEEAVRLAGLILVARWLRAAALPTNMAGAMLFGASFALVENLLYARSAGLEAVIMRQLTAVPLHVFVSGLMAAYLREGLYHGSLRLGVLALVIPVVLHGLYNWPLLTPGTRYSGADGMILSGLVLLLLIAWVRALLRGAAVDHRIPV